MNVREIAAAAAEKVRSAASTARDMVNSNAVTEVAGEAVTSALLAKAAAGLLMIWQVLLWAAMAYGFYRLIDYVIAQIAAAMMSKAMKRAEVA